MTHLAAILDLCVWAGEGFDGLEKWLVMPENVQALWWEHFNNVRSGAYRLPEAPPAKSRSESMKEADEAEKRWMAAIRSKQQ